MYAISVILFLTAMLFAAVAIINSDKLDTIISRKLAITLGVALGAVAIIILIVVETTI